MVRIGLDGPNIGRACNISDLVVLSQTGSGCPEVLDAMEEIGVYAKMKRPRSPNHHKQFSPRRAPKKHSSRFTVKVHRKRWPINRDGIV
jgi:hypothetical protein